MSRTETMGGAAIIVLLGPGEREARRFNDFLASLVHFEKEFVARSTLVVVNDRNDYFDRAIVSLRSDFSEIVVLNNPYVGRSGGRLIYDRLTAGLLAALRAVIDSRDCDFVLKADTDALVCGSFSGRITQYFRDHPGCGMIGSLHHDPDGRSRNTEEWWGNWIRGTCGFFPSKWLGLIRHHPRGINPMVEIGRWYRRNQILRRALRAGWKCGDNVLGGAYALSPLVLLRLQSYRQLLSDVLLFDGTRNSEDVVVSMLVASLGLTLDEYNREGEVFGIWYQLPSLTIDCLMERRYALVHSIKMENREEEGQLRAALADLAGMSSEYRARMDAFQS